MKNIFSGRLIFVLVVTVLSLFFVYPTAHYFNFVASVDDPPTDEQVQLRTELLSERSMIKLGLDLQGGVDFLIAVDTDQLVRRKMAQHAESLREEYRLDNVDAKVALSEGQTEILVTLNNPMDAKLAEEGIRIFIEDGSLETDNLDDLNGGVVVLRKPIDDQMQIEQDSVEAALKTIKNRVDQFGLTQPVVVKQPPNRIRVQIPGETDPARIREGLLRTANLEFRLLHPDHDNLIGQFVNFTNETQNFGTGKIKPEFLEEVPSEQVEGATITRLKKDIPGLPANYRLFLGEEKQIDASGEVRIIDKLAYILRDAPELTGANLRRAAAYTDPQDIRNPYKVTLEFDSEGTEKFADVTTAHTGKRFAILLDSIVMSAPNINEPILYGRCEITGNFSNEEALDLALVLKAGSLPAPLKVVNEQQVGASLGADSVRDSGIALMIGGILVVILIIGVYRTAGVIASLAMLLNVLLILAILSLADATLTLSGIGGILLTMGMAVDANVLIYERLREELEAGKPIRGALNSAFGRAFTVILDSNITTLLPALVLILFEIVEGSVKGFWTALAIGLIANLYTGLTVTRALVDSWVAGKKSISVGTWRPFHNSKFNFLGMRKIGYGISGALVAASVFYLVVHGVNPGVDFTGGVMATVETTNAEIRRPDIEAALAAEFRDVRVVEILNKDNVFQATVPKPESMELAEVRNDVGSLLAGSFGDDISISSLQSVDSFVGDEFKTTALMTVLVASLIILGYVGMRFKFAFGVGAIAALVHDLLISLGIFVLLGKSLTLDIVSALLIILGYSVNDTIVTFDRVRENMTEMYGKSITQILNKSINQTLSRTAFTSSSTITVILAMLFFGGIGLRDFALILLLGMITGTYSSIFIASAIVNSMLLAKEKREGAAKAHGRTKSVKMTATSA